MSCLPVLSPPSPSVPSNGSGCGVWSTRATDSGSQGGPYNARDGASRRAGPPPPSCASPHQVVFWVVQLLYTVATFLPAKLAFDHQWACAAVMWALLCLCVWNGANYYIEDGPCPMGSHGRGKGGDGPPHHCPGVSLEPLGRFPSPGHHSRWRGV